MLPVILHYEYAMKMDKNTAAILSVRLLLGLL